MHHRLIASYNTRQYVSEADNSLDEDTLQKLSSSATAVLIDLQDEEYSFAVDKELARRANKYPADIWEFNFARSRSDKPLIGTGRIQGIWKGTA